MPRIHKFNLFEGWNKSGAITSSYVTEGWDVSVLSTGIKVDDFYFPLRPQCTCHWSQPSNISIILFIDFLEVLLFLSPPSLSAPLLCIHRS